MWTKRFWLATAERVTFTAAETLLALILAAGFEITDFTTGATWSVVGIASAAALLKSVIAGGKSGNPSFGNVEQAKYRPKHRKEI